VEEKTKSQKEQVPAAMLVEAAPVKREVWVGGSPDYFWIPWRKLGS
jgi:hypothetical protein